MTWEMPPRQDGCGAVSVTRHSDNNKLVINVTQIGEQQTIVCSPYNAASVIGMLWLFLALPTSGTVGGLLKRIKL